jgi:hypothetical protein
MFWVPGISVHVVHHFIIKGRSVTLSSNRTPPIGSSQAKMELKLLGLGTNAEQRVKGLG